MSVHTALFHACNQYSHAFNLLFPLKALFHSSAQNGFGETLLVSHWVTGRPGLKLTNLGSLHRQVYVGFIRFCLDPFSLPGTVF